jgi:methylthioribose-1-phosphate isomerase
MDPSPANFRTLWPDADGRRVHAIDQTKLPHRYETVAIASADQAAHAIRVMQVRGAPLIGATAAYGLALALAEDPRDDALARAIEALAATRPTAVNLAWALARVRRRVAPLAPERRASAAWDEAGRLADEDVAANGAIGTHGCALFAALHAEAPRRPLEVLTHCNAGALATVGWGTALAPIYRAHAAGIPVHVWVDETRPRNQGASLTAWELARFGIPHTVIVDNAGGHLMQHGRVDCVIVGADRVSAAGDACNKIGTYLKALAAHDNGVPFYVAAPSSTIDWTIADALRDIPIEERSGDEVSRIQGRDADGQVREVRLLPDGSRTANPAFDVTPARLVDAIVTERGACAPGALRDLFERS